MWSKGIPGVEKESPGGKKKHTVLKKQQVVYSGWLAHRNDSKMEDSGCQKKK